MKKPLGIIFDLGETILEYEESHPEKGTEKLLGICHNPNNVDVETIQQSAKLLTSETFLKRDITQLEISFQGFQRLLYETHKVSFDKDYDEIERIYIKHTYVSKPSHGIRELLDFLKEYNIKIGALSNSSFTGRSLKYELDEHGLGKYFDFIISSADYCLRKPNTILFNLAVTKMDLNPEDIWFIGDSYKYDIVGAAKAGLFPVWYNKNNSREEGNYLEIKDMSEVAEIIKLQNEQSA